MKKTSTTCFLVYLCLLGSEIMAQKVASPPTAEGTGAPVVVYGQFDLLSGSDTVYLTLRSKYLNKTQHYPEHYKLIIPLTDGSLYKGTPREGSLQVDLPGISVPSYLSITDGKSYLINDYLVMPGDSIKIRIDQRLASKQFGGKAAALFECQYRMELATAAKKFTDEFLMVSASKDELLGDSTIAGMISATNIGFGRKITLLAPGKEEFGHIKANWNTETDWRRSGEWKVLLEYKDILPPLSFNILRANLIGRYYHNQVYRLHNYIAPHARALERKGDASLMEALKEIAGKIPNDPAGICQGNSPEVLFAPEYQDFLFDMAKLQKGLYGSNILDTYLQSYPGELKDRMIGSYLIGHYKRIKNGLQELEKAISSVQTEWIKSALESLYMSQTLMDGIYTYAFWDTDGREINMNAYKGKVVLMDFWYTGCKACINFFQSALLPVEQKFADREDIVVLSINTDTSETKWKKSIAGGKYTNQKMINLTTSGKKHPFIKKFNITGYPHQVILTADGKLFSSGSFPMDPNTVENSIVKALRLSQNATVTNTPQP